MSILFVLFALWAPASAPPDFVNRFHGIETTQQEKDYIATYKGMTDAGIQAYVTTLRIKQLSTLMNPYSKWRGFKRHTAKLNQLASTHPNNIHVRYCRLMVQEQSPSFLGYTDFLEQDRTFLRSKLNIQDDTDYMDHYIRSNTSL